MWSCTDNQTCLHQSLVCDGIVHCRDSSDEDPSKCSECPLPFGHKSGSGDATLPCLHRFSGRPICADPCDGIDDLCQDLLDEQCSNRVDFIVAIAVVLVGAIVLVTVLIIILGIRVELRWASGNLTDARVGYRSRDWLAEMLRLFPET